MTEEENKAIWYFSELLACEEDEEYWKVIENLIDKKQKQIEQLANGIRVLGTNPDITTEEIIKEFTEKPITEEYMKKFKSSYISKDEVLKALGYEENDEEYERLYNKEDLILSLIRTINEECDRLEDIEDQKVEVAVAFIEEKRDKYWKDKIEKELLEPINKERQETYKEFMKKGKDDYHGVEGSVLQELNWVVGTIEELLGE